VAADLGQNSLARQNRVLKAPRPAAPGEANGEKLMSGRRFWTASSIGLVLLLGGCSETIGLYHDVEGGAISKTRQPPPGMDQPYPNLADVPAAPPPVPAGEQAVITAQARNGVSAPSPGALQGLALPASAPPLPNVPGLDIPARPTTAAAAPAPVAQPAAAPLPPGPPVAIGFPPRNAILPYAETIKIKDFAATRGDATVLAGGFGDGSLPLALSRARRVADALTASGVPGSDIRIVASAAGSGGFVQLVY
jgi:hypothetical protein